MEKTGQMEIIKTHFPELTDAQLEQFERLKDLYQFWNEQINVISRKDIEQLYNHHVLHSLAVIKFMKFRSGARILDLGTGGGFPGIPLAIYYPKVSFTLIDARAKKIKVVENVASELGLENVVAIHGRAEELKQRFDFVTARAVAPLDKLFLWTSRLIDRNDRHAQPNGLIAFKGGDIEAEIKALPGKT